MRECSQSPVTDGLFVLQEPRHLQLLADLEDCSVFSLLSGKKQYSAPTEFGLCLKVRAPPQPRVHPARQRSQLTYRQSLWNSNSKPFSRLLPFLNRNIVSHWLYSFM